MIFHIAGQFVVKLQLGTIEVECCRANLSFCEKLLDLAGFGIGKCDESLLGTAQVKWRLLPLHRLLKTLDAAVNVRVE